MKRVITSSLNHKWYMKYYTEATPEQVCEESGCDMKDLMAVQAEGARRL